MEIRPVRDTAAFQQQVLSLLPRFWDDRDVRHLHHPVWFRQFGNSALAAHKEAGVLGGYLLEAATPAGGYVHLIATLPEVRGQRVGRALYARFASAVLARGGGVVEAVTSPANRGSIAFHERVGFRANLVTDYAGPGEDRVHFQADAGVLVGR